MKRIAIVLALLASACSAFDQRASNPPLAGPAAAAVVFDRFEFKNQSNLDVSVVLEAPPGKKVRTYTVKAMTTDTFSPDLSDVSALKVIVNDGTHDTEQTFDLRGAPYRLFIEALRSVYQVGSLRGDLTARY